MINSIPPVFHCIAIDPMGLQLVILSMKVLPFVFKCIGTPLFFAILTKGFFFFVSSCLHPLIAFPKMGSAFEGKNLPPQGVNSFQKKLTPI